MKIKLEDSRLTTTSRRLCDVEYGAALLIDVQPGVVYIKVNKERIGSGIVLTQWTKNSCVLFNPKLGTLRERPGHEVVTLLDIESIKAQVTGDARKYTKGYYSGKY